MSHFVLEIGTEEIPARFLQTTEKELAERFTALLKENRLGFEKIETRSTPRRAIVHIYDLEKLQPILEENIIGPAVNIAYDKDGNLSKAGQGFIRGQGAEEKDIVRTQTEKGEYISVNKKSGGKKAEEVLQEICPQIIAALPFPKRMRWGEETFAYARPLQWVLAMLDHLPIVFKVGDVVSSNQTYGHRVHGFGPFVIGHADDLEEVLYEKSRIVCDSVKRRQYIIDMANTLVAELKEGAKIIWKNDLLDEVQGLVEKPVPVICSFDESFLELPKEVILTTIEHHQKCFGIQGQDRKLLNKFLTVLNIEPEDIEVVRAGWERVVRARLEDARFYWKEDLKDSFAKWVPMLDSVIFLGPLGSMGDKSRRLEQLCGWLGEKLDLRGGDHLDNGVLLAQRAGRWCKADLMSKMVGEFDTLQGTMGSIYALKEGWEPPFAMALTEQYLPTGPNSLLPMSDLGACLSMADKADTLVGCFGLGNIPTGTADPYALRRAALGIARILLEFGYEIPLSELFEKAYSFYADDIKWKFSKGETLEKLLEFCQARLKHYFVGEGSETLVVDAVMNGRDTDGNLEADNVWATEKRLNTLKAFMRKEDFTENAQVLKRMTNILAKAEHSLSCAYDSSLLESDAEKELDKGIKAFSEVFDTNFANNNFMPVMDAMAKLRPLVDAFFESVMVMAEDKKVRQNRMNMLFAVMSRMNRMADFANLQI